MMPENDIRLRAIAVSGAFIRGNVIIIGSLEDSITLNGDPILKDQTSEFELDSDGLMMKGRRSPHSSLVQDLSVENPGVNLELPMGVKLIVNRLHGFVNVAIEMPLQKGGQEGLCGSFPSELWQ